MNMANFNIETFLNQWMPVGGTRVDAVFSLSAADGAAPAQAARTRRVVGLLLDVSGSMSESVDGTRSGAPKIEVMRPAAQVAVEGIAPEDEFFVIAYSGHSQVIVPLVQATPDAKRAAVRIIAQLKANGGTFMSKRR